MYGVKVAVVNTITGPRIYSGLVMKSLINPLFAAYLHRGFYNVILVDWNALSALPWYFAAVQNCQVVGLYLARFLDYLDSRGVPLSNVHVIGFSLGAEVAGFTGKHLRDGVAPRLRRITGKFHHWL